MPSSDTQFKPGQSGNPFGRPKLTKEQLLFKSYAKQYLVEVYAKYGGTSYTKLRSLKNKG